MADSKVTDLPAASTPLTGAEVVYLVQGGLDTQGTAQDIADLSGNGDVSGPASATDNAIARFDGTTGKLIQNGLATVDDSGVIGSNGANLSGNLNLATTTSSRALVTDGTKNVVSSATTATEIGYVNGVTSAIQTQIDGKQASGNYITALTGEVTASGPGSVAATVTNSAVISKVLTGFSAAAGVVAATDTILQGFNKVVGNITALVTGVSSVFGRTGAVTAQAGDYTTAIVADSTNKRYVTDAQLVVIGNTSGTNTGDQTITLTGAVTGTGTGTFATTIATPGTVTVSSTNSTATAHTHAVTSSSAPGAAASLLATDSSGIIGSTGTRLVKGWFTDLTVTNAITGSVTGNAATVTTNANLTGAVTSTGNATSLGSFTSSQLATALTDETGSGAAVFATSPTLVTPVLGVASATSLSFSSTSGIIGTTTNNDAATGSVGEYVESVIASGSAVSLTSITAANVTSISLTAGDWDVWGTILYNGAVSTTVLYGESTVNVTSATRSIATSSTLYAGGVTYFGTVNGQGLTIAAPMQRIKIASTTTVYLVAWLNFSVSTANASGFIAARRRR